MDSEITDAEIEKLILKREKKKEYQRIYDANKYQQIKEKRLADNKKYYQEKTKPKLLEEQKLLQSYKQQKYAGLGELIEKK
jgi:hypothetical protein